MIERTVTWKGTTIDKGEGTQREALCLTTEDLQVCAVCIRTGADLWEVHLPGSIEDAVLILGQDAAKQCAMKMLNDGAIEYIALDAGDW